MTRPKLALAFGAAVLVFSSLSSAAGPEPYIAKFQEGRALLDDHKYIEALDKFKESAALKEASGTLLNMGDCQEHLGLFASATASFERARQLAVDEKKPEREKEAADRATKLDSSVSKLTVKSLDESKATLDGKPVELNKALPVDAGWHVIHADVGCKRGKDLSVNIGLKGDIQTVTVDPSTFDPDPACSKGPVTVVEKKLSTGQILGLAAGGVGIVAAGFGVGFGVSASDKKSDLESMCPTYPSHCAASQKSMLDSKYSDAHTAATLSTVFVIGAIVLVGGGVALYMLSGDAHAERPQKKGWGSNFVPGRWTF